jgi:hypothetical protein
MSKLTCRFCTAPLQHVFADLGNSPLSNAFLKEAALQAMEPFYPLCAYVCEKCLLVQVASFAPPEEIFSDDYAYFSSFSTSWLAHCEAYAKAATQRFGLGPNSQVIEIASNDGYLLQYFKREGVKVLGVEPAQNVADAAIAKGIPTISRFFGTETASTLVKDGFKADLLCGNNVYAHVPDLNDFTAGMKVVLAPKGTITLEFPHILTQIAETQFDTIYHEHFSYFSLTTVQKVMAAHGLEVFDVDQLTTHGGSLRVYARHAGQDASPVESRVGALLAKEKAAGLAEVSGYLAFQERVEKVKRDLLRFLIDAKEAGKTVAGYGAPAKGNTLLNFCGVRPGLLPFTVDRSPQKQGRYLPGSHVPVYAPERLDAQRPDYVVILPWNLRTEIAAQLEPLRRQGTKLVVPIPALEVF